VISKAAYLPLVVEWRAHCLVTSISIIFFDVPSYFFAMIGQLGFLAAKIGDYISCDNPQFSPLILPQNCGLLL